jgi:Rrf2 family protein
MLKLTKKADYGLIAMKHLAANAPGGASSAKEIAACYGIPPPLLAKVLQKLTKTGLLHSLPGTNGGYKLARAAGGISAFDVIRAIDGPIILTGCFTAHGECDQSDRCTVREPLRKIHEGIIDLLTAISIADMSVEEDKASVPAPPGEHSALLHVLQGTPS